MTFTNLYELKTADIDVRGIVANCVAFDDGSLFDYSEKGRSNFLLHYIADENAVRKYTLPDGGTFSAKCGDVIFIPAGSRYATVLSSADGGSAKGIGISFDLATAGGEPVRLTQPPCVADTDRSGLYKGLFTDVYCAYTRERGNRFAAKAALFRLLDFLLRRQKAPHGYYTLLRPAFEYIDAHLSEKIAVADLAALCFLSETHFRRLFTAYTGGLSPCAYILNLKLDVAEELAESPSYTLEQIAEHLHFFDGAALCKAYKTKRGRTLKARR